MVPESLGLSSRTSRPCSMFCRSSTDSPWNSCRSSASSFRFRTMAFSCVITACSTATGSATGAATSAIGITSPIAQASGWAGRDLPCSQAASASPNHPCHSLSSLIVFSENVPGPSNISLIQSRPTAILLETGSGTSSVSKSSRSMKKLLMGSRPVFSPGTTKASSTAKREWISKACDRLDEGGFVII